MLSEGRTFESVLAQKPLPQSDRDDRPARLSSRGLAPAGIGSLQAGTISQLAQLASGQQRGHGVRKDHLHSSHLPSEPAAPLPATRPWSSAEVSVHYSTFIVVFGKSF